MTEPTLHGDTTTATEEAAMNKINGGLDAWEFLEREAGAGAREALDA